MLRLLVSLLCTSAAIAEAHAPERRQLADGRITRRSFCPNGANSTPAQMNAVGVTFTSRAFRIGPILLVAKPNSCRAACDYRAACRCALAAMQGSAYYGGLQCSLMAVPCNDARLGLAKKAQAPNYIALAKCTRPKPPMAAPPGPRCWAGPGPYPWTTYWTAPGVWRVFQDSKTGVNKQCTCTVPAGKTIATWSCGPGPYGSWRTDYGFAQYSSGAIQKFRLNPPLRGDVTKTPLGTRIMANYAALSGSFCADVLTTPGVHNGAVFSMYVTTGEPPDRAVDKWDEVDFEFLLRAPHRMWLNQWHDGAVVEGQEGFRDLPFLANEKWHRYCLVWTVGASARWFVDGALFHEAPTEGWTKPLTPAISIWGMSDYWTGFTQWKRSFEVQVKGVALEVRATAGQRSQLRNRA